MVLWALLVPVKELPSSQEGLERNASDKDFTASKPRPCKRPTPSNLSPQLYVQTRCRPKRRALAMTETELRLMAAPAIIGLSSQPVRG